MFLQLAYLLSLLACCTAVIDNGIQGEPEVECGPTSVSVHFNTKNAFEGSVFVKGHHDKERCTKKERGKLIAGIELPFDACNVARMRSLNPKGVFVSATVVVSFHPIFVTEIDRAFRVECFYMETDKMVSSSVDVAEMVTEVQTRRVPLPSCHYEILDGGPSGGPLHYANLGQQVYHKWSCDTETVDTFCVVVHSCTVDDGFGNKVQILDQEGCAVDKHLLGNLEYIADLTAGQSTHVYKYADKEQLFYQCQITVNIKEPNSECPHPVCDEPIGFAIADKNAEKNAVTEATRTVSTTITIEKKNNRSVSRWARSADEPQPSGYTMDVRAELSTNDQSLLKVREMRAAQEDEDRMSSRFTTFYKPPPEFCLSPVIVISFIFFITVCLTVLSVLVMKVTLRPAMKYTYA